MQTPLSQSQLGVYYACLKHQDQKSNYQNANLARIPSSVNLERLQAACYKALCAHPYLATRIVLDESGLPCAESGCFPSLEESIPIIWMQIKWINFL